METTEKRFESDIESAFLSPAGGYTKGTDTYDPKQGLYVRTLLDFVQATQPKEWARFEKQNQVDPVRKFCLAFNNACEVDGLLSVLRHGFKHRGITFHVCYFKPESSLNQAAAERYAQNRIDCYRQWYYSADSKKSVDMVLTVNGIPVFAFELEHKEMKTLPVEQLTSFLREAKDSGVFELYYIELATGLRRGELLGLKWEDIDLEQGNLRVHRQIARINGEIVEAPLKTKNAYRTLPLSADAVGILREQKKKSGNSPYVFPSPTGGPISPDSVLHMLHRVLKRAGLSKVRFHDLRHTFATLALQNGVDIKTVSGMLGHYSAGFTLDTYTHVTTSAKKEAANTMGSILSGALQ